MKHAKSSLSGVINIGKDTEKKLKDVGIDTFEKLQEAGSEGAFLKLQENDPGACLSLLYGLEGAVTGIKWNELPDQRKNELIEFHKKSQGRH